MNEAEKTGVPEEIHDEPIRYVPVLESSDVPIQNITFRYFDITTYCTEVLNLLTLLKHHRCCNG
jgi:hypothetical protein